MEIRNKNTANRYYLLQRTGWIVVEMGKSLHTRFRGYVEVWRLKVWVK